METLDRSLLENENFNEIFLTENFNGTWTQKQLQNLEEEFNDLSRKNEQRRQIILNRFFHATCISNIIIKNLVFVSETAMHVDFAHAKFSELQRAEMMSKHLSQFSNLYFGSASKKKDIAKHDEHVKTYLYSKIPQPYQKKYNEEPRLIGAIELIEERNEYMIVVKHLKKTGGFCNCVNLHHRETMYAVPIAKISHIKLEHDSNGSCNLHIEIAK